MKFGKIFLIIISNKMIFFSFEKIRNILFSFIFFTISLQAFTSPFEYKLFKSFIILSACLSKYSSKKELISLSLKYWVYLL